MSSSSFLDALRAALPNGVRPTPEGPVIEPASAEEVSLLMRVATEEGGRLSPPGALPEEGRIPVSLARMNRVIGYDEHAHIVHAEAGISIAALADDLRRRDRALGLSGDLPTIDLGAFLASGAPTARSKDDDPVAQLVAGLTAILPDGRALRVRPAPRRAVGPDLVSALIGARGALGIITAVHLVTRPRRTTTELSYLFASRDEANAALARIRGSGARPEASDVVDAPEGAALFLSFASQGPLLGATLALCRSIASSRAGIEVGPRDMPAIPPPVAPVPCAIIAELAAELDPAGVLSTP